MPYDNIEDIWKYLLIKADISLVSDFWFEPPQNFLQHKLEGYWKYEILLEYSISVLSFIFKKSQLFSLFPTYNLIGVSYGHAFFYWYKDTSFANFSNTSNMLVKSTVPSGRWPFVVFFISKQEKSKKT